MRALMEGKESHVRTIGARRRQLPRRQARSPTRGQNALLAAARAYARPGWAVHPLWPGDKRSLPRDSPHRGHGRRGGDPGLVAAGVLASHKKERALRYYVPGADEGES